MDARFNMFGNEIAAKFAKRFANASMVIQQSPLPQSTQELVSLRASQINGCGWCIDMHTKEAAAAGETAVRLNLVAAWRESTVFTEAEQAALALAEESTRLADAPPRRVRRDLVPDTQALRRQPDRRPGLLGRPDQRGQPARRDRAPTGRLLPARHVRRHVQLIGRQPRPDPGSFDPARPAHVRAWGRHPRGTRIRPRRRHHSRHSGRPHRPRQAQVTHTSVLTRTTQQIGGSFGTAVLAVVLERAPASHPGHTAPGSTSPFSWTTGFTALAVQLSLLLPRQHGPVLETRA
jgi:AhpD family alkylhydroperoxidase